MKGIKHPNNDVSLNDSGNTSIVEVLNNVNLNRRQFLMTSISSSALVAAGGLTLSGFAHAVTSPTVGGALAGASVPSTTVGAPTVPITFTPIGPNLAANAVDVVTVPQGYTANLFVAWGDPIVRGGVAFSGNATETAAEQRLAYGEHTDGMHFFPFAERNGEFSSERGLLVSNSEYTHETILHPDGQANFTIAKARKSQAAHGVNIMEARRVRGNWGVQRNSIYGRRIDANTRMRISGPAAGHALMKTPDYTITDSATTPTGGMTDGTYSYGTANNCAHGYTPWGTYLTCEENFNGYFGSTSAVNTSATFSENSKLYRRYGINATGFGYKWHEVDPRWDLNVNPNGPNTFGWVVEIDPFNTKSVPVKRTALGRFKHESVQYVVDAANDLGMYSGDDERNDYIYKFVASAKYNPNNRAANRDILDNGTLYVARFDAGLTGVWLPLTPGSIGLGGVALRDNPNFSGANDAEVLAKILIKTRMAADAVGATMMDRPEWIGARPRVNGFLDIELYCTMTNNSRRGTGTQSVNAADGSTAAAGANPPVDAANPRANNVHGGVIRWREDGRSVRATTFTWDIFVQCGDTQTSKTANATNDFRGDIVDSPNGSADYGAPDGLWFDDFGRMWVQTDSGSGTGDFVNLGMDQMVCVDPSTKETKRFLTACKEAEVTGVTMSPDGKTMWVGIQHPGDAGTAANPQATSSWPHSQWNLESDGVTPLNSGRPRSGVVVITKNDGGIIGT